jgi:hypothetical protein
MVSAGVDFSSLKLTYPKKSCPEWFPNVSKLVTRFGVRYHQLEQRKRRRVHFFVSLQRSVESEQLRDCNAYTRKSKRGSQPREECTLWRSSQPGFTVHRITVNTYPKQGGREPRYPCSPVLEFHSYRPFASTTSPAPQLPRDRNQVHSR